MGVQGDLNFSELGHQPHSYRHLFKKKSLLGSSLLCETLCIPKPCVTFAFDHSFSTGNLVPQDVLVGEESEQPPAA